MGREVQSAGRRASRVNAVRRENRFHFPAIQPDRPVARADQCPDRPTGPDITPAPLDRLVHNRRDARRHGRAGPGGNQRSGGTARRHPLRRSATTGCHRPGSHAARARHSRRRTDRLTGPGILASRDGNLVRHQPTRRACRSWCRCIRWISRDASAIGSWRSMRDGLSSTARLPAWTPIS